MGEWLGDTPIFQKSMSESERKEFENFKRKVPTMPKTIDQPVIADFPTEFVDEKPAPKKPARKTTAKKAQTKKETAVKTTKKTAAKTAPAKTERKKMTVAEVKERFLSGVVEVKKLYPEPAIEAPYNPSKENGVLNRDPEWNDALRYIAADCGWTDNRFLYMGAIKANGGKVKAGAYGVPSFFGAGFRPVYNWDDIEWEKGEPTEWKKPERKKAAPKAQKAPAAPKANDAELKKLQKENAELKKTLEGIAATQESTAAVLAALVAKLGL